MSHQTHHATPKSIPVPTGTTEAVAKAICEMPRAFAGGERYLVFEQCNEEMRDVWMAMARVAITAYETARATTEKVK